jgi:outer membrane protein OmpA-like peptidoglycan-associated protein
MKHTYLRKLTTLSISFSLFVTTGCAVALIGIGAGIGAFAYINGKLIKTYESEYHKTIAASRETLEELKIPVTEEIGDELNTIIRAKRPNGTPISIEVERIEQNLTEVSVRSGAVGVWDREVSMEIHELINAKLDIHEIISAKLDKIDKEYMTHSNQEESSAEIHNQKDNQYNRNNENIVIYFNHNSNDLSEESKQKLDEIAKVLIGNPHLQISVKGFSDSSGSDSYNKLISESRAAVAKVYLVGKGTKPSQIDIEGLGAQNFIGSNKTEEGRKLNRRVEIKFVSVQKN